MFNFLLGALLGATSLYYYSEKVGPKVQATNAEILELLRNKALLRQYVAKEIRRMKITGELDDYLLNINNILESSDGEITIDGNYRNIYDVTVER